MTKRASIISGLFLLGVVGCGDDPAPAAPVGCEAAEPLVEPGTIEGSTKKGEPIDEGSCITGQGAEVRYKVVPTQTGMLDLTLNSDADLGLYVRTNCSDGMSEVGCTDREKAGSEERLSVPVTKDVPVWIVVDGYDGKSSGPFTLAVKSRPISCGDNLVEGAEQCDPPDGGKTCKAECTSVPEACGDSVDNDGDLLTDCEDVADCGSDAACSLAAACGAAQMAQASQNGDSSSGSGEFAGSCTGGALTPEAIYSYMPASAGALVLTLQSAKNQGVYVRMTCADPATELGCLDDQAAGKDEMLVVPVEAQKGVSIFVDGAAPAEAGMFTLMTSLEASTENEPNNASMMGVAYAGAPLVGTIYPSGDADFVKVDVATAGATLAASVEDLGNGDCTNFKLDSQLEVYGPDGTTLLAENDDAATFCSVVEAKTTAAGTHYVRVSAAAHAKMPTFAYRLNVTIK